MPLNMTETRYSLVKGERIVRYVSITRLQSSNQENSFKNMRMLLKVTKTRYSLVKGERIVRFVLITQLRLVDESYGDDETKSICGYLDSTAAT
ncbi:hypothetical protein CR513_40827, partial [Mucuna pruriens]